VNDQVTYTLIQPLFSSFGFDLRYLGQPRMFGARLKVRFLKLIFEAIGAQRCAFWMRRRELPPFCSFFPDSGVWSRLGR
jgi:hypothetical protein